MSGTILLDGIDITSRVLSTIRVTRKERSAATASFVYSPSATPSLPDALIGVSLTIDWLANRIFTGKVTRATWRPGPREYEIHGSDLLQETFEALTEAQILAAIPGSRYSRAVFGDREDGWQQAMDCMSTVTKDVHLDRAGNLQAVDYAAKGVADRTLTAAQILNDGAYDLDLAERRDLVTQQKIKYEYRVSRWKQRRHSYTWSLASAPVLEGGGWCEWRTQPFYVPTREQVLSAAAGSGWRVDGAITFKSHPASFDPPDDPCGLDIGWYVTDEAMEMYVTMATWDGLMSWAQTVTETYEVTLNVPPAQTSFGVIIHEDSAARSVDADDAGLESGTDPDASGWQTDPIGDKYQDQESETDRDNDIQTLMGVGVTRIWESLRGSSVTVHGAFMGNIELSETVAINTPDINARGKVREIEHTIDGRREITRVRIAISRGGAGPGDTLATPARPNTLPSYEPPNESTIIPTYAGNYLNVPNYDPAWEQQTGFVTNRQPWICVDCPTDEQIYNPMAFRVKGEDIEDQARDENTGTVQVAYNVSVPNDVLTLL